MFIRLFFIFCIFFTCGPAAYADLSVDAQSNSVLMPDVHSGSVLIPDTHSSSPNNVHNPPDEITLEANIVQIILNDEHREGVDWGAIVSDYHTAPLKKVDDPVWNDNKFRLSFGTVSEDDYSVLLDALDMAGQMSQAPQPPLKITEGIGASIRFEKQNIHVQLKLLRLKSGDLSLRIDPYIAVSATELSNDLKIPVSVLLQAGTNLLIANNTTIVIGGFIKEEEITRKHKLFLLGDIPIVGLVFRSKGHLMQKTETVIFLTVRTNAVEPPEEDR